MDQVSQKLRFQKRLILTALSRKGLSCTCNELVNPGKQGSGGHVTWKELLGAAKILELCAQLGHGQTLCSAWKDQAWYNPSFDFPVVGFHHN